MDRFAEARALTHLGNTLHAVGQYTEAERRHRQRLKLSKELQDLAGEGRAHAGLGNVCQATGRFEQAVQHHERHIEIARSLGLGMEVAGAYGNLGNAYFAMGRYRRALHCHEQDLAAQKEERARHRSKQWGEPPAEWRPHGNMVRAPSGRSLPLPARAMA